MSKESEYSFPKRFTRKRLGIGNIKAPKGFVEEDLRKYYICGSEEITEELNAVFYHYENKKHRIKLSPSESMYGVETGDIYVEVVDREDEVEVSVYRLIKRWIKKK